MTDKIYTPYDLYQILEKSDQNNRLVITFRPNDLHGAEIFCQLSASSDAVVLAMIDALTETWKKMRAKYLGLGKNSCQKSDKSDEE